MCRFQDIVEIAYVTKEDYFVLSLTYLSIHISYSFSPWSLVITFCSPLHSLCSFVSVSLFISIILLGRIKLKLINMDSRDFMLRLSFLFFLYLQTITVYTLDYLFFANEYWLLFSCHYSFTYLVFFTRSDSSQFWFLNLLPFNIYLKY